MFIQVTAPNGIEGAHSPSFTKAGDSVIFFATDHWKGDLDLYVTDGTPEGTSLIFDFADLNDYDNLKGAYTLTVRLTSQQIGMVVIPTVLLGFGKQTELQKELKFSKIVMRIMIAIIFSQVVILICITLLAIHSFS